MNMTEQEIHELNRLKMYFPYRVVSAVKLQSGHCEFFADTTRAKANNYARKNNGVLFRLGEGRD